MSSTTTKTETSPSTTPAEDARRIAEIQAEFAPVKAAIKEWHAVPGIVSPPVELLNVLMPKMDGWAVLSALKAAPEKNTSLLALIQWMGFDQANIVYTKEARTAGVSKLRRWRELQRHIVLIARLLAGR